VRGWDRPSAMRMTSHYFQLIARSRGHYRFDLEAPWTGCRRKVSEVLLSAAGRESPSNSATRAKRFAQAPIRSRGHPAQPSSALARDRIADGTREAAKYLAIRPPARTAAATRSASLHGSSCRRSASCPETRAYDSRTALEFFPSLISPAGAAGLQRRSVKTLRRDCRFPRGCLASTT